MLDILAAQGELPDPNTVGPGTLALVVFIFMLVAVVFLMRSMRKQLKRVDFPEDGPRDESDKSATT